jgi:hypothetical protein
MASPPLKNLIKKLKGQRAALESLIEAALYDERLSTTTREIYTNTHILDGLGDEI